MKAWEITLEVRRAATDAIAAVQPPELHKFQRPRIAIGAGGTADLQLPGDGVSTPHCELLLDDSGGVRVADLGSRLGTLVNGRPLTEPAPISPDDEIGVPGYSIRLTRPARSLDAPGWQLTFEIERRGGERTTKVLRQDHVWIGRASACDISLPNSNVARRHCYVAVRPEGVAYVADSMSTNGTYLNGSRVGPATPLRVGDKIYVGDFLISLTRPPERIG